MSIIASLKPIIRLLLMASYAAYCVIGLACIVLGAYYAGAIDGAFTSVITVTILSGLLMLMIGGLAVYATMYEDKRDMAVVLVLNAVLFIVLLATAMIAACIVLEVEDPVAAAAKKIYSRTGNRVAGWPAVVETFPGGPDSCEALHTSIDTAAAAPGSQVAQFATAPGGGTMTQGLLAGNCSRVHALMDGVGVGGYKAECELCWLDFENYTVEQITGKLWPATVTSSLLFLFVVILATLNTYMVGRENWDDEQSAAAKDLGNFSVASAQEALYDAEVQRDTAQAAVDGATKRKEKRAAETALQEANDEVKKAKAALKLEKAKDAQGGDEGDKWRPSGGYFLLGSIFNIAVLLFGLATAILGVLAYIDLTEGCEQTQGLEDESCINWACIGVINLGTFLFTLAGVSLWGLRMGGFLGRNLVRVSNICFVVLAFLLLLTTIAFGMISGAVTPINREFDLHFPTVRSQAELQDCNVCASGDDIDEDGCNDDRYTDSRCRAKLRRQTEENLTIVMELLLFVCAGFVAILWLTLQAVKIYSGATDDDSDDEDEDLSSGLL